jgi:hypothetical protein
MKRHLNKKYAKLSVREIFNNTRRNVMKITREELKQMVKEEFEKMKKTEDVKDPKEVDADEFEESREDPKDYIKMFDVKEARLRQALKRLQERKKSVLESQKK